MPPINQQGSRAGLITALVIFVVLFVVATIFAFYYNSQWQAAHRFRTDELKKYQEVTDDPTGAPEAARLRDARERLNLGGSERLLTVADVIISNLSQTITGRRDVPGTRAIDEGRAAIRAAAERVGPEQLKVPAGGDNQISAGVTLPSTNDNLVGVIETLSSAVVSKHQEMLGQVQQKQEALQQLTAEQEARKALQEAHVRQLEEVRKQTAEAIAAAAADRQGKQSQLTGFEEERQTERQAAIEAINRKDREIANLVKQMSDRETELQRLRMRLGELRPDVKDAVVRQTDGRIASVGTGGVVYIDRGQGDQIMPGLTFEVFDKNRGVPGLGSDPLSNENMPESKGSIEVTRVGATSSEARVVSVRSGQNINQGDLIVNLVYDPNTRYNFTVYGRFDLDQNGIATDEDAAVIRRLITQWGGQVSNEVSVDTDFLVIGAEPQVPSFSREDLENPANELTYQNALAAQAAYEEVIQRAVNLHIPILNQNRFLHFVGYYDLARR